MDRESQFVGDVAVVFVRIWNLEKLWQHPETVFVVPLCIKNEMDISIIEINLVEPITCSRLVPSEGRGALIGIIDSGFAGLVLGAAYLWSGRNLWVTILAHGFIDTFALVAVYLGLSD